MAVQLYLFDANCSQLETFSICQGPIHPCRQIYRGGGSDNVDDDDDGDDDDGDDDGDDDDDDDDNDDDEDDDGYDDDDDDAVCPTHTLISVLPGRLQSRVASFLKTRSSTMPDGDSLQVFTEQKFGQVFGTLVELLKSRPGGLLHPTGVDSNE